LAIQPWGNRSSKMLDRTEKKAPPPRERVVPKGDRDCPTIGKVCKYWGQAPVAQKGENPSKEKNRSTDNSREKRPSPTRKRGQKRAFSGKEKEKRQRGFTSKGEKRGKMSEGKGAAVGKGLARSRGAVAQVRKEALCKRKKSYIPFRRRLGGVKFAGRGGKSFWGSTTQGKGVEGFRGRGKKEGKGGLVLWPRDFIVRRRDVIRCKGREKKRHYSKRVKKGKGFFWWQEERGNP